MEYILAFVTLALAALVVCMVLFFVFAYIIEPAYILVFNRPVYVHFYPVRKTLEPSYASMLQREFSFYSRLSERHKSYFRHRVAAFIEKYSIVGREGLIVTEEMKVKIAATSVMLTFGFRGYLSDLFSVIILYPDAFLSANGEDYHKGEFNPLAGAVVFSWKHFEEGMEYGNDNLNLGLHEFAHVLHFDSRRRRRSRMGTSSVIYIDMFDKIMQSLQLPQNRQLLADAGYLRDYAYTNQYEFIAVVLEHFFETPSEFRRRLPALYSMVKKMINYGGK